jgi:hypothetical protein
MGSIYMPGGYGSRRQQYEYARRQPWADPMALRNYERQMAMQGPPPFPQGPSAYAGFDPGQMERMPQRAAPSFPYERTAPTPPPQAPTGPSARARAEQWASVGQGERQPARGMRGWEERRQQQAYGRMRQARPTQGRLQGAQQGGPDRYRQELARGRRRVQQVAQRMPQAQPQRVQAAKWGAGPDRFQQELARRRPVPQAQPQRARTMGNITPPGGWS